MQWLNINLTTLRSPAYLGSNPVERATWLQLLAYCADQENGGRIAGAAAWKDRQWQQTCGVTAREVRAASRLVMIEGGDVRVAFYPLEQEAEMKLRREKGREAANKRWHGGEEQGGGMRAEGGGKEGAEGNGSPIASGIACGNAERNGREWNGNGNGTYATPLGEVARVPDAPRACAVEVCAPACSSREAVEHGARLVPPCPEQWCLKWWEDCERRGWVDRDNIPVRRWQPALSSYWRGVQEMERRCASTNGASFSQTNGSAPAIGGSHAPPARAMSAYDIKTRLGAIDDELSRIRMRAKDGRSGDGLRNIKLYTPGEEARRDQLLKAKEVLKRKLTEV